MYPLLARRGNMPYDYTNISLPGKRRWGGGNCMLQTPPAAAPGRKKRFRCLPATLLGIVLLVGIYIRIGCPLRWLTGLACPGCGMTRALAALLRLDFSAALRMHPLVCLLPPAAVWLVFGLLGRRLPQKTERRLIVAAAALLVTVYLIRLLAGDSVVKPDFSSSVLHNILSFWRGLL
jgi:hypothetical protein